VRALAAIVAVVLFAGAAADAGGVRVRKSRSRMITTASGLQFEDLEIGKGTTVHDRAVIEVHYTLSLAGGKVVDSTLQRRPLVAGLGRGQLIPGFEEGLVGMKVGGKRRFVVPPALGYGDRDVGKIPRDSTLVFEIHMVRVIDVP
jgi:peptidylprolyl isomerase